MVGRGRKAATLLHLRAAAASAAKPRAALSPSRGKRMKLSPIFSPVRDREALTASKPDINTTDFLHDINRHEVLYLYIAHCGFGRHLKISLGNSGSSPSDLHPCGADMLKPERHDS